MSAIFASRLSWVPSRLAWALTDRPTRSKGMWYGFAGAFLAGIAVASFATTAPKVDKTEQQTAAFMPEKAEVPAKPAPTTAAKPAKQDVAATQKPAAERLATEAPKVLAEVPKPVEPPKPVAEAPKPTPETSRPVAQGPVPTEAPKAEPPKVVAEAPVRVIAPDRITPAPGAAPLEETTTRATPATTDAPASARPTTTAANDPSRAAEETATLVTNDHGMPAARDVPMPRPKPAAMLAAAPQPQPSVPATAPQVAAASAEAAAEPADASGGSPVPAITGRVPEPRSKPAMQTAALDRAQEPAQTPPAASRAAPAEVLGREEVVASRPTMRRSAPSSTIRSDDPAEEAEPTNDHFAAVARLQTGASRSERLDVRAEGADRAERWGRGERNSRPEMMDERERRRIDRAEERAVSSRVSESRRRNEAEGFELVRTYRLPDGRRVSVYQRGEPRVAMRQPGLFGRPAFLLPPPGAMWR